MYVFTIKKARYKSAFWHVNSTNYKQTTVNNQGTHWERCLTRIPPPQGGTGRLLPVYTYTYPFHIPKENCSPFIYLSKITPLSYTSGMSQSNKISYNRQTFSWLSVVVSFRFSCSKRTSFFLFHIVISARIWHHLIYFA